MIAAIGRQLKQSVNVFHSLILYRRLPSQKKKKKKKIHEKDARKREKKRTFVIKAINPINTSTLMVTPQDEKVFRIFDLVRKQQTDSLK